MVMGVFRQMRPLSSLLQSLVIPALIGCIAALAILLWAPHWVAAPQPLMDPVSGESITSPATVAAAMAGPGRYADAVEKAAPAVANIYTRTLARRQRQPAFARAPIRPFFR